VSLSLWIDPEDFVVFRSLDIVLTLAVDRKLDSPAASLRQAPDQSIDGAKVQSGRGAPPTPTPMLASERKASRFFRTEWNSVSATESGS
jgi:hypothetical protein